ncbi:hypothetical protein IKE67_08425 [bacterium]|nr:hypothetical protein [bacterium]
MGYAAIQTMLLSYKLEKSNKEFELMQITNKLTEEASKSRQLADAVIDAKSEVSEDDPDYVETLEAINDEYNLELAEIAEMEDELDRKKRSCETQIGYLDGYIETWTAALQQDVAKSHTYGAQ